MKIRASFNCQLLAVTSNVSKDKEYFKAQVFVPDTKECGEINLDESLKSLVPGAYDLVAEYNDKYQSMKIIQASAVKGGK